MELPVNLGKYRLVERIGDGGSGAVFRAEFDGPLGVTREVAVKMLYHGGTDDSGRGVQRLYDEARLLARLDHSNIVRVHELVLPEGRLAAYAPALVMDLVRGPTLARILHDLASLGRGLPLEAVVHLATQLADTLHHAHELAGPDGRALGIVHRDLKPSNLMIRRNGDLAVLDFGIAWAKERLAQDTLTGELRGTLRYMSPEQANGNPVDRRSDLYSLGLLLFEVLVGRPFLRFEGGVRPSTMGLLLELDRDRFRERLAELRASLRAHHGLTDDQVEVVAYPIVGLLQRDPTLRTPTAQVALRQLDAWADRWSPTRGKRLLAALTTEGSSLPPNTRTGSTELVRRSTSAPPPGADPPIPARLRRGRPGPAAGGLREEPTSGPDPSPRPAAGRWVLVGLALLAGVLGVTAVGLALSLQTPPTTSSPSPPPPPLDEPLDEQIFADGRVRVEVAAPAQACVLSVEHRPARSEGVWRSKKLRQTPSGSWAAVLVGPMPANHRPGLEYWIRCTDDGVVLGSVGSREAPRSLSWFTASATPAEASPGPSPTPWPRPSAAPAVRAARTSSPDRPPAYSPPPAALASDDDPIRITVAPQLRSRPAGEQPPPRGDELPGEQVAIEASATGTLRVTARPRCRVHLIGGGPPGLPRDLGTTDDTRRGIKLPADTYRVRFVCDDEVECAPFRRHSGTKTITVIPGKETRFHADFYDINAAP